MFNDIALIGLVHISRDSLDQPGKVVNPARGQLNREYFPVLVRA